MQNASHGAQRESNVKCKTWSGLELGLAVTFAARVAARVRCVPAGQVTSYGAVAAAAGRPGAARAVGRILARLPEGAEVPWWRVVSVRGEITIPRSCHGAGLQRALLADEGVRFDGAGRVDMGVFGWRDQEDEDG